MTSGYRLMLTSGDFVNHLKAEIWLVFHLKRMDLTLSLLISLAILSN